MSFLLGRVLLVAASAVVFGLTLFGVYANVQPTTNTNTQDPAKSAIPFWEPGDEGPTTEHPGEAPTTPILLPTPARSSSSEDEETPVDQWADERMEAASKEPFDRGSNEPDRVIEGDDLLRGAFDNPAARRAEPSGSPEDEPLPPENTATWPQDPAQLPIGQYPDAMPQQTPPLTPPSESQTGEEAYPQAPLESPTDAETHPHTPPPDSPTGTATSDQATAGFTN